MNIRRAIALFILGSSSVWRTTALAQSAQCGQAYEHAQEEKAKGHVGAALVHLRQCIDVSCPQFVRDDCSRWMDQAEAAMPSVVFAVRRDGVDQVDVEVTCDGQPFAKALDGKALVVDPGIHTFSFRMPGLAPVEQKLLVHEGERNRIVDVEFHSLRDSATSPTVAGVGDEGSSSSEISANPGFLRYGLAGVGALGVLNFALFAALGNSQQSNLERTCSPRCDSSQVSSVKTKYLIADASLGVGMVSLGIATYLFIANHSTSSDTPEQSQTVSVRFAPSISGGLLELSGPF